MSTFAPYITPKSRKGSSTMYYKDEDFTPEALCQEIEEMFDMDVEVEENPQGTFKYRTVDGSPMSKDIVCHVYQAYIDCDGENSRDYVRIIVKSSLYEEEVNGDVLLLRESQFEGEYISKWKGYTIATIATVDDGLYAGQYSLTEWGQIRKALQILTIIRVLMIAGDRSGCIAVPNFLTSGANLKHR